MVAIPSCSSLGLSDERQLLRLLALVVASDVEGRQVAQMTISFLVDAADHVVLRHSIGAEALENALVHLLVVEGRILVDFIFLVLAGHLANGLRLAQSVVEHALIVAEEGHLASEARVPMILRPREGVVAFFEGGRVGLASASVIVNLGVLSQLIVERALLVSRLVDGAQAARRVRDVCVATAAVIRVHNWLRVDVRERLSGSLLGDHKRAYNEKRLVSHKQRDKFQVWHETAIIGQSKQLNCNSK